jgi:transposase InsO family protein
VAAWIDEYNRDRRHSACDMRSPVDYELRVRTTDDEPDATAAA